MGKNNNSVSLAEGICWAIAAVLYFTGYWFLGNGVGIGMTVVTLVALLIIQGVIACENGNAEKYPETWYILDIIFTVWGFFLVSTLTDTCLWGFVYVAGYAAIIGFFAQKERLFNVLFGLIVGACSWGMLFGLSMAVPSYLKDKQTYSRCLAEQNKLKSVVDSTDMGKFSNPYLFYSAADSLQKAVKAKRNIIRAKTDSLKNELAKEKSAEILMVDFPKLLRIKRIWLNSDTQPWTYWSYTHIYLHSYGGSSGFWTRFGRIGGRAGSQSLEINGSAKGVGETRLDYINVVLSDNSFHQLKIKDSYEWLVAKEGELVEADGNKLVPLFKK